MESIKTYRKLWSCPTKWCSVWRARRNWSLFIVVAVLVANEQELFLVGARGWGETAAAAAKTMKRLLGLLQLAGKRAGGWHETIL